MDNLNQDDPYHLALPKKDFIFTLVIAIFFIVCFCAGFYLNYGRIAESIADKEKYIFSVFQISILLAITLACIYVHYSTKITSFFYLALFWLAHVIYKVFTISFIPVLFTEDGIIKDAEIWNESQKITIAGENVGKQYLLIAIIALAADLPLLLSSFPQKERKWWLFLVPISAFILMVIIYNSPLDIVSKVKILYFISPTHSFLIFLWVAYSITFKNILSISKRLSIYFGITFVLFAISQIPFIYESYCTPFCQFKEYEHFMLARRLFSVVIFLSALIITLSIAKDELSGIRKEKESAEKQLEVKGEFENLGYLAASIEHELRNPLEVVKKQVEKLIRQIQNDKTLIEQFSEKFQNLEKEVYRVTVAANVINILRLKKEDFADLLEETLVIDRVRSSIKRIKMEFPLWIDKIFVEVNEKSKELYIQAYFPYLEQTFVNLLKNAYESIDRTGKTGKIFIEISTNNSKDKVIVIFRDSGGGFLTEDIAKLTRPDYTRKDTTSKSNRGLGLFVCDRVVNLHGGTIRFSNDKSGGAEITLEFPRYITKKMLKEHITDS